MKICATENGLYLQLMSLTMGFEFSFFIHISHFKLEDFKVKQMINSSFIFASFQGFLNYYGLVYDGINIYTYIHTYMSD